MKNDAKQCEFLEQFDRDAAQLLITLECRFGAAHWITAMQSNGLRHIRKSIEQELKQQ